MALLKRATFSETAETTELSIPANTVFTGNITTQSNARINGTVQGDILSGNGNILFGVGSNITGNVTGGDIAIGGGVRGDVTSRGQLSIFAGAKVFGNVAAGALVVEKDAVFEGHVKVDAQSRQITASTADGGKLDKAKGENVYVVEGEKRK